MFVVGIPVLLSSLGVSYYYYSSSTVSIPKLPSPLQDEIKKGRIDSEKENIIKSNINFKLYNLKKSKITTNENNLYWYSIFKLINERKFILKSTSIVNKPTEEIELQLFDKPITKSSVIIYDHKQLYFKEKLIKTFHNQYLKHKLKVINKNNNKNTNIENTLDRLHKCLQSHNIKVIAVKVSNKIKDQQLVAKNNQIKEMNKVLKFPKEIKIVRDEKKENYNNQKEKKSKNHTINQPMKYKPIHRSKFSIN
jgi:hypothetical protein